MPSNKTTVDTGNDFKTPKEIQEDRKRDADIVYKALKATIKTKMENTDFGVGAGFRLVVYESLPSREVRERITAELKAKGWNVAWVQKTDLRDEDRIEIWEK